MMKPFLVFVFSMLLLIAPASAEVICNTKFQPTNVRKGPGANDFPTIGTLPNGAEVEVVKRVKNTKGYEWVKVVFKTADSDAEQIGFVTSVAIAQDCNMKTSDAQDEPLQKSIKAPKKPEERKLAHNDCNLVCTIEQYEPCSYESVKWRKKLCLKEKNGSHKVCQPYSFDDYDPNMTLEFSANSSFETSYFEKLELCGKSNLELNIPYGVDAQIKLNGKVHATFEGGVGREYFYEKIHWLYGWQGIFTFHDGEQWQFEPIRASTLQGGWVKKIRYSDVKGVEKEKTKKPPRSLDVSDTVYLPGEDGSGRFPFYWYKGEIEDVRGEKFKVHIINRCNRMTNNEINCNPSGGIYRIGEYRWFSKWEAKDSIPSLLPEDLQ